MSESIKLLPASVEIPEEKKKNKGGRPRKASANINWDAFDALCFCCCTLREIAFYFHCSEDTIEREVKKVWRKTFAAYYAEKEHVGKASIRQRQFQVAMKGNPAMLIWLGKQWLGQKERAEISSPADLTKLSDADLMKLAQHYGVEMNAESASKRESGQSGTSNPRVN